jgi:hypothetical protein
MEVGNKGATVKTHLDDLMASRNPGVRKPAQASAKAIRGSKVKL